MNTTHCGVDIVEVKRIAAVCRRNKYFLKRVFTPQEISYCSQKKFKWQHFAVRFAAKEAVWKAAGSKNLSLRDIGVTNSKNGKPQVVILGKRSKLAKQINISLSHTRQFAVAMAVSTGKS